MWRRPASPARGANGKPHPKDLACMHILTRPARQLRWTDGNDLPGGSPNRLYEARAGVVVGAAGEESSTTKPCCLGTLAAVDPERAVRARHCPNCGIHLIARAIQKHCGAPSVAQRVRPMGPFNGSGTIRWTPDGR